MSSTNKAFVLGVVVGVVATHIYMNAQGRQPGPAVVG